MVREKKIYYDHLVDKTQQKHRIEGYELKKLDFYLFNSNFFRLIFQYFFYNNTK